MQGSIESPLTMFSKPAWFPGQPVVAAVLFENRKMKKAPDTVSDVFVPWDVHIYQW